METQNLTAPVNTDNMVAGAAKMPETVVTRNNGRTLVNGSTVRPGKKPVVIEAAEVVARAKAEEPKPEMAKCSKTGAVASTSRMLVEKLGTIDVQLKRRATEQDLLGRTFSIRYAIDNGLNRDDLMILSDALVIVREEAAREAKSEAARKAKAEALKVFRQTVYVGHPMLNPADGKLYFRCVQARECHNAKKFGTAFVASADMMRAPMLSEMQELQFANNKRFVTMSDLAEHFVLCPDCAKTLIEGEAQSVEAATKEIEADLEVNAEKYEQIETQDRLHHIYYATSAQSQQGRKQRRK